MCFPSLLVACSVGVRRDTSRVLISSLGSSQPTKSGRLRVPALGIMPSPRGPSPEIPKSWQAATPPKKLKADDDKKTKVDAQTLLDSALKDGISDVGMLVESVTSALSQAHGSQGFDAQGRDAETLVSEAEKLASLFRDRVGARRAKVAMVTCTAHTQGTSILQYTVYLVY